MPLTKPTEQFYGALQSAYDFFNKQLFDSQLPTCLITAQRESNIMGHFLPARWINREGRKVHEIAINPAYFPNHNLIQVFQTLVHEQCHLWQQEFGNPSRSGYHNKEWAHKMISVGLVPTDTGLPGGRQVGQHMSDYLEPGGRFQAACVELIRTFDLPWIDRYAASRESCQVREVCELTADIEAEVEAMLTIQISDLVPEIITVPFDDPAKLAKRKVAYACGGCGVKLWGKPGIFVICGECEVPLESV